MSSIKYSAELTPDPGLRRVVLVAGMLAGAGGVAAVAVLSFAWHWRLLAGLTWCLWTAYDLWLIARANKACERLRIHHDGRVQVVDRQHCCSPATIESGSLLLRRVAWLRIRTDAGQHHVELMRRKSPQNNEWRRLQVIWRHLGAAP